MMNQTIIDQHESFKKEIENIKKENGNFLIELEQKLMLENRENFLVTRRVGEDTIKSLNDSMKSLSEQLFNSLPKIIEKRIQEPENLVDKETQLDKKTSGKEVKNPKNKSKTEISSSSSKTTNNGEAEKIFTMASNSLSEYFEQKKREEEDKLKEINKRNEESAAKRREQKQKAKDKKKKQKEPIKESSDIDTDNTDYENYEGRSDNQKTYTTELYAEDFEDHVDNDKEVQLMLKNFGLEETLDLLNVLNIDTSTLKEKTVKMLKKAYDDKIDKIEDNPYRELSDRYYDYEYEL